LSASYSLSTLLKKVIQEETLSLVIQAEKLGLVIQAETLSLVIRAETLLCMKESRQRGFTLGLLVSFSLMKLMNFMNFLKGNVLDEERAGKQAMQGKSQLQGFRHNREWSMENRRQIVFIRRQHHT
jgi:hypothetical protein